MIRRLWRKNDKHSVWTKIEQKKYAERKLLKLSQLLFITNRLIDLSSAHFELYMGEKYQSP